VVLIAAFAMASLLTMAAVSRRVREFGTLKALGWRSRRIVGQVMGETLVIGGQDLAALPERRVTRVRATSIGFIFQTFNLIPTLSAQENVEAALVPLRKHAAQRRALAAQSLADVGLGDRLRHLPSELSGGQQQRVAIARALVKKPTVLLADEPTGNLDEGTRDEIIVLLEKLWRELGLTLILVTHDTSVARRAQRAGQMRDGRLSIKQDTRRGHQGIVTASQADPGGPASPGPQPTEPWRPS
jgi:putative ABC transport system ATP-binding protein